jgi:hypothetical protein
MSTGPSLLDGASRTSPHKLTGSRIRHLEREAPLVLGSEPKVRRVLRHQELCARKGPAAKQGQWVDGPPPEEIAKGGNSFSAGPTPTGSTSPQISCAKPFASKADERYKFCVFDRPSLYPTPDQGPGPINGGAILISAVL